MDECVFKVGQRVWCFIHGWGEVEKINLKGEYPIIVKLEKNGELATFTNNGIVFLGYKRSLFFSEIPIPPEALVPPKPKRELIPAGSAVEVMVVAGVVAGNPILTIIAEDNDPEKPPLLMLAGGGLLSHRPDVEILRIWPPAKAA